MNGLIRLWVIFITGGVVLALELITSRIMTPYFGVSLYIWASILSITLLFLALGYAIGGWAVGHYHRSRVRFLFYLAPALSALWLVGAAIIYPSLFKAIALWDLVMGSFVACTILLSFPLFYLSALNPFVVALIQEKPKQKENESLSDHGVGHVLFISTLGSVAGVLATTFLILPKVTNYTALLILAVILAGVSIVATMPARLTKTHKLQIIVVGLLVFAGAVPLQTSYNPHQINVDNFYNERAWRLVNVTPSSFGTLHVVQSTSTDQKKTHLLYHDGLWQNFATADGTSLTPFTYALEWLGVIGARDARHALVMGLGAGIVPDRLAKRGIEVDIVEINPAFIRVAKEFFNFHPERHRIFLEDARTFVARCPKMYDLVVVDIFQGDGAPLHVVTQEFFQDLKRCMKPGAAVVMNSLYDESKDQAYKMFLATIRSEFGPFLFFHAPNEEKRINAINGYLLAWNGSPPGNIDFTVKGQAPPDIFPKISRIFGNMQTIDKVDALPLTDAMNRWHQANVPMQLAFRKRALEISHSSWLVD
ncbi:MAG: fused MFS/spermidine synthase [Magnetococcales bacterium]|nr:fused MFS/spermidine synthase [Magnetococcales bacterium]